MIEKVRNNPMHRSSSMPFADCQKCLAKTRRGGACQVPAMKNGRCRMHGGASSGAPYGNKNAWKHGKYSEWSKLVRSLGKIS